jgi:hypothetical protein
VAAPAGCKCKCWCPADSGRPSQALPFLRHVVVTDLIGKNILGQGRKRPERTLEVGCPLSEDDLVTAADALFEALFPLLDRDGSGWASEEDVIAALICSVGTEERTSRTRFGEASVPDSTVGSSVLCWYAMAPTTS